MRLRVRVAIHPTPPSWHEAQGHIIPIASFVTAEWVEPTPYVPVIH